MPPRNRGLARSLSARSGSSARAPTSASARRRGPFQFVAFDVLLLNGKDVRRLALADRKGLLQTIVPKRSSTVLYAQHVVGAGRKLFETVCAQDLEGIVAKHRKSIYGPDEPRQWVKVKNAAYPVFSAASKARLACSSALPGSAPRSPRMASQDSPQGRNVRSPAW